MATTKSRRETSRYEKSIVKKARKGGEETLLMVFGLAAAHHLNKMANKFLNPVAAANVATSGLPENVTKYATSGALVLLGIFAPELSGKYSKYLRPFGSGMAAYGGATAIKEATGASVLSGQLGMLKHYREPNGFMLDRDFPSYPERIITRSSSL
jgi:hypothetical protein